MQSSSLRKVSFLTSYNVSWLAKFFITPLEHNGNGEYHER